MGNGSFIRGNSEHGGVKPSLLSQYGANLMNHPQRRQYLKKRQGNGGSPVETNIRNDSSQLKLSPSSNGKITNMPGRHDNRTTVRIRTKNN